MSNQARPLGTTQDIYFEPHTESRSMLGYLRSFLLSKIFPHLFFSVVDVDLWRVEIRLSRRKNSFTLLFDCLITWCLSTMNKKVLQFLFKDEYMWKILQISSRQNKYMRHVCAIFYFFLRICFLYTHVFTCIFILLFIFSCLFALQRFQLTLSFYTLALMDSPSCTHKLVVATCVAYVHPFAGGSRIGEGDCKSRSLRVTTARSIGVHYGFTVHRITSSSLAGLSRIISCCSSTHVFL